MYGERIIVYEKDNSETIDGITDYWYKIRVPGLSGFYWVFGGYLANEIPSEVEPVLGMWNTDRGENYYWDFTPQHKVASGKKETDTGIYGIWTLSEYIGEQRLKLSFAEGKIYNLAIITTPTEFTTGESQRLVIIVQTLINRNRIYFQFENGNGEFLDRNNNIF